MFDYIIVGAGSAGAVLAHRLSEDPHTEVLLLEAGQRDTKAEIHIPAAFSKCFKTEVDWGLYSTPQAHAHNRKLFLPRGKVLGGSSSINAMIYIRGNKVDFDYWKDLGNEGWGYDDLLPYFKKSENFKGETDEYHGQDGPLHVSPLQEPFPVTQAFVKAGKELGYRLNPDFNGERQEGFGCYHVNQIRGKRHSSAKAFLKPIRNRKNLTILTETPVSKILIEGNKAVGVLYRSSTHYQEVKARKEVILAAGAYHSPQLLMVSGIGEAAYLPEMGINVKQDLQGVGKNLQDHLIVPFIMGNKGQHSLDRADKVPGNYLKFLLWGDGPLSSNVAEGGGFIHTREGLKGPDIQFHFGPAFFKNHGFELLEKGRGYSIGPTLLQPDSVGEIKLASADMSTPPLIDHKYLEAKGDVDTLVAGLEVAYKLSQTSALQPFTEGHLSPTSLPSQREEWEKYVRETAQTLYHPIGTCKMGHDPLSVVDTRLRVHGIQNLRVIDASVMPHITRGNTHAPTVAIAEKGAEMIIEDRQEKISGEVVQQMAD